MRPQSKLGESLQFLPDIAESSPFVVGLSGSVFSSQQQNQAQGQGSLISSDSVQQVSTTTAENTSSRANPSSLPKTAVSKALGIEVSSSLSSVESSGSIGMSGRASPRISRDEVKRRLMKTRTSATEIGQGDDGDLDEDDSGRHTQLDQTIQDRDLPPLPSADTDVYEHSGVVDDLSRESMSPSPRQRLRPPNSRSLLPRPTSTSSSLDLHKPGVDLGEVRSALDRLMLGVERGFVDESGSLNHDTSFMDETADSSVDYDNRNHKSDSLDANDEGDNRFSTITDMSLGEIMGVERAVFVEAQTKRPNISPPSPLLSGAAMTIPEAEPSSEHRTPSMTETETEEEGPLTPSVHSMSSPFTVVEDLPPNDHNGSLNSSRTDRFLEPPHHTSNQEESEEKKSGFRPFSTNTSNGSTIDLNSKALPAVPQPRLSLDLSISSSFHESEFGLDPGSLSPSRGSVPEVPSINVKPPAMSGKEIIKVREDAILNKRREIRRLERGGSVSSHEEPDRPASSRMEERPQRRRSRSTGDATDVRSEVCRRHSSEECYSRAQIRC